MEHEIIGHTKKAYKIVKDPGKSLWEKLKEIGIEILIIVFAVTFAAFIERSREHSKEKAEAKEFVVGLKGDLSEEISALKESMSDVDTMQTSYQTFMKINTAQADSINKNHLNHTSFNIAIFYTPVINGRYDGFKSSGKIQTIENDSLRNDILQFYQNDIPLVTFSENAFNDNQKLLKDLVVSNTDDKSNNPAPLLRVLSSTKGKIILGLSIHYSQAVKRAYDAALTDAKKIDAEIKAEEK